MSYIFYGLLAVLIIGELLQFGSAKELLEFKKKIKGVDWEKVESETKVHAALYVLWGFFYLIVCVVGLMTSQWLVFAAILIMSFIPKRYAWIIKLDALVTIALLSFAIVNRFHLHLTIF